MKLASDMLLVVHVPKTAGTSFRQALEKSFGKKKVIRDYGPNAKATSDSVSSFLYSNEKADPEMLIRTISKQGAKVLIGHFSVKKYVLYIEPKNIVAFVRDPLERTCSEYLHRVRHKTYKGSFEKFIQQSNIINIQSNLLQDMPEDAMIGVTERYRESLRYINGAMGLRLKELKENADKLGGGPEYAKNLSQAQLDQFYHLNQKDVDLYDRCLRQFSSLDIPEARKPRFIKWFGA